MAELTLAFAGLDWGIRLLLVKARDTAQSALCDFGMRFRTTRSRQCLMAHDDPTYCCPKVDYCAGPRPGLRTSTPEADTIAMDCLIRHCGVESGSGRLSY